MNRSISKRTYINRTSQWNRVKSRPSAERNSPGKCIRAYLIIYIGDLLANIKSEDLLSFADVTKLFQQITRRDDALVLQSDLSLLEQWSNNMLLNFHPDKCHVITLETFDNTRHTYRYHINHTELEHLFFVMVISKLFSKLFLTNAND